MSSDCDQISSPEHRAPIRRLPWFTSIFAVITLVCWFGGSILMLPLPEVSDWLALIGGLGVIIAVPWLIVCAFLPRPLSAPILLATLVIIQTARMIDEQLDGGLVGLGFRIDASPVEQYLAKCHIFDFVESGEKFAIGFCESRVFEIGFPAAQASLSVIYDPTGNFRKPDSQRSAEWKQAFGQLKEYSGAWGPPAVRRRFGDFYLVLLAN